LNIDELNNRFAIVGLAQIAAGNGGLPRVSVSGPAATAEIYLHGAQLTSWCPAGADEVIFFKQAIAMGSGTRDSRRHPRLLSLVS
jgi:glucose-6-phosphate 1-epimerase